MGTGAENEGSVGTVPRAVAVTALITGITGQDGSYLADQLRAGGRDVVGLARSGADLDIDLDDHDALRRAVAEVAPAELYHLAAPTFVPASFEQPGLIARQIAGATQALLDAAIALPSSPRVFVATSAEIFGDCRVSPQDEDAPKRPRSPYGEAKLAAHEAVARARERGLFAVSGILYNHESPRRPAHFLPRKVTRGAAAIALGLEDRLVLGSLDAVRDWSHAADMMRGARLALEAGEARDYVFASGVGRTVGDLVAAAFDAAGVPAERRAVDVDPAFVRPPEATAPVGDPSRARRLLGWRPEISFEAMIAEMVAADLERLRR